MASPDFEKDILAFLPGSIRPYLEKQSGPGKGSYFTITKPGIIALAEFWQLSPRGAMIKALRNGLWPLRFKGNRGLLNGLQQARLLESQVAVVGCGGLGGGVILLLARFGVGRFILCDGDCFDESNLNRQLLSREDRLGKNKALIAQEELSLVASHAEVTAHPLWVRPENLPGIIRGADLAIDCLDNLITRRQLETAAHGEGLTFIHGAIAGLEGLALVSRPGFNGLSKMYGQEEITKEQGAENMMGVPTVTPVITAAYQVFLAVKELLGQGESETRLWHLDLAESLSELLYIS